MPLPAPSPVYSSTLRQFPGVRHAFFTRQGGVSTEHYASLNIGKSVGDNPQMVAENRARIAAYMETTPERLCLTQQVHGVEILTVTAPVAGKEAPAADAMVTRIPGLALCIQTADCAPVLFAAPQTGVVGATHAGWRGALAGILEATIASMEKLGARRQEIYAAVGPCIHAASYEVDTRFRDTFLTASEAYALHFHPAPVPGKYHFDLPGFITSRLQDAGLHHIDTSAAHDTCAAPKRFFSHRYATLRHLPATGRQGSLIMLPSL